MTSIRPGQIYLNNVGRELRVMAVAEGYVMARYRGAMVWVMPVKEFLYCFRLKVTVP